MTNYNLCKSDGCYNNKLKNSKYCQTCWDANTKRLHERKESPVTEPANGYVFITKSGDVDFCDNAEQLAKMDNLSAVYEVGRRVRLVTKIVLETYDENT